MATCYNDDLLFIHIPRCGGTSITDYLEQTIPGMTRDGLPIGHIRLQDIEALTGRKPSSFDKIIAVVRDPFAAEVSAYDFSVSLVLSGIGQAWHRAAAAHASVSEAAVDPMCKIHGYYESQWMGKHYPNSQRTRSQLAEYITRVGVFRYWIDVDGEIPGNVEVIRLEDIWRIAKTTYPYTGDQDIESFACNVQPLKRLNRSSDGPGTRKIFTSAARNAIRDNYRWTIDNFYPEYNTAITGDHHDGKEKDHGQETKAKEETEDCDRLQVPVNHVTSPVC